MRMSTSTRQWLALVLAINSSRPPPYNANPICPELAAVRGTFLKSSQQLGRARMRCRLLSSYRFVNDISFKCERRQARAFDQIRDPIR
jgi:hypothetical protein